MNEIKRKMGIIIPMITKQEMEEPHLVEEDFVSLTDEINCINGEKIINFNDELAADTSLELTSPLSNICGAIEMMEVAVENDDQGKVLNYINTIKNNCYKLAKNINNALELKNIESKQYELNYECINIVEVMENIVDTVCEKTEQKGMRLIFDTSVEEIYAMIDARLFEKSILNILSETFRFSTHDENIFVDLTKSNLNILIVIKTAVFDIGNETIGLKLSKEIIKYHDGTVSMKNANDGFLFIIQIPSVNSDNIYNLYPAKYSSAGESIEDLINREFSDIINSN